MKYICLVYQDEPKLAGLSDAEMDAMMDRCGEWIDSLERGGHHVFSSGLQCHRTAVSLRRRDGKISTTDGPFAETKEFLGGFTILEARDLNEALQLAANLPAIEIGTIEVRPMMQPGAEMADPLDKKVEAALLRKAGAPAR